MYWASLLHFYQPHWQKRYVIDAIAAQCYRPVAEGILANPRARLTINFTGGLLDQLAEYGHRDVIDMYVEAARRGQVEFVSTAKYHAILPLLPEDEALRQIEIQNETGRRLLGDTYRPQGIFLPEMAWSPRLARVLERAGVDWVMLDELAYGGRVGQVDYTKTYRLAGSKLKVLFREHRLSATVMSAAPRNVARLKEAAGEELAGGHYIVTGFDGETFGHHRVGHEQLLFGMFADPELNLVRMSEIFEKFPQAQEVETVACTWASSEDDLVKGIAHISWLEPGNDIHALQWQLLKLAVDQMERLPGAHSAWRGLRERLDRAVASDQFFWASAKPWWMIEHIERGAHGLMSVVRDMPGVKPAVKRQVLDLYHQIVDMAYEWQRCGKIDDVQRERAQRVRVPFKDFTKDGDDPATWQAVMELMREAELEAAARADYEEAILWRNAIYSLEHKLDIYDAIYVIDLIKRKWPADKIEQTVEEHRKRFDRIRGGQVEQRTN